MPTVNQVTEHAKAWINVADKLKSAFVLADELSRHNSINDPNWNDLSNQVPGSVTDGVVTGTEIAPADISNAIGSINNFLEFFKGTSQPAQSAWINNIEKIAKPIV